MRLQWKQETEGQYPLMIVVSTEYSRHSRAVYLPDSVQFHHFAFIS
jgi:hypothetical protein